MTKIPDIRVVIDWWYSIDLSPFQSAEGTFIVVAVVVLTLASGWIFGWDLWSDKREAIKIHNWVWDAQRVEHYYAWQRGEAILTEGEASVSNSRTRNAIALPTENDLLLFDELELRTLRAREIDLILLGQNEDKALARKIADIEAGISRRQSRIATNAPTPGISVLSAPRRGPFFDDRQIVQFHSGLNEAQPSPATTSGIPLAAHCSHQPVSIIFEGGEQDGYLTAFAAQPSFAVWLGPRQS